jgi:DNA-binding NarL/FixJ family response regulator
MLRLLLVDDVRLSREGLAELMCRQEFVSAVVEAMDQETALAAYASLRSDVVLINMTMAESVAMTHAILEKDPAAKIIALGISETEPEVISYAEAGISGYLCKDGGITELSHILQAVTRGEMPCSPRIAALLRKRVADVASRRVSHPPPVALTHRELEIIELIDLGCSNKEIAKRLTIQVLTVKNHVHNILAKLGVQRRGEAAARMRKLFSASESAPRPLRLIAPDVRPGIRGRPRQAPDGI